MIFLIKIRLTLPYSFISSYLNKFNNPRRFFKLEQGIGVDNAFNNYCNLKDTQNNLCALYYGEVLLYNIEFEAL